MNRYSATYFQDSVTIPRELLSEMGWSNEVGDKKYPLDGRVSVEYRNGKILIQKVDGKENPEYESMINRKGAVPLPETLSHLVEIKSGDVLDLTFDDETLEVTIFDKNDIPNDLYYANEVSGLKAPPGWICEAFTANPSSEVYVRSGLNTVKNFDKHLQKHGVDYKKSKNILDFGCGAGRVLSSFNDSCEANLFGVDLHEAAIKWCNTHLEYGTFSVGKEKPPLDYRNNQFDFIYAISVFTHLNEVMQNAWLAELKRISAPGATLILSYRGEDYISNVLGPARQRMIREGFEANSGFFFEEHTRWDGIFPSYYCDTFHTHDYIRNSWGEHFEVLELIQSGDFSNKQNAAILRNTLT